MPEPRWRPPPRWDGDRTARPWSATWGDGATTQGWFPQPHAYVNPALNYMVQVTSHEDDGSSDCAQIMASFAPQMMNGPLPSGGVFSLAVDQGNPSTVYAATQTGVFKTTNGGQNWTASGPSGSLFFGGGGLDASSATLFYAAGRGVYTSSDGGRTWASPTQFAGARTIPGRCDGRRVTCSGSGGASNP